jgi:hypothetical protein
MSHVRDGFANAGPFGRDPYVPQVCNKGQQHFHRHRKEAVEGVGIDVDRQLAPAAPEENQESCIAAAGRFFFIFVHFLFGLVAVTVITSKTINGGF